MFHFLMVSIRLRLARASIKYSVELQEFKAEGGPQRDHNEVWPRPIDHLTGVRRRLVSLRKIRDSARHSHWRTRTRSRSRLSVRNISSLKRLRPRRRKYKTAIWKRCGLVLGPFGRDSALSHRRHGRRLSRWRIRPPRADGDVAEYGDHKNGCTAEHYHWPRKRLGSLAIFQTLCRDPSWCLR